MIQLANLDGALQDIELINELATLRIRAANIKFQPPRKG